MDPNLINQPENAATFLGKAFWGLASLAGALKCWTISRRPATNTKSVLALMFAILAYAAVGFAPMLKGAADPSPASRIFHLLAGMLFMGFTVCALVLAILGLSEYSRQPGVFEQGRAQAIWALVLVSLFGVAFVYGFIRSLTRESFQGKALPPGKELVFQDLNFRFRAPDQPWVSMNASKINPESQLAFIRRSPETIFFVIAEKIGANTSSESLAEIGKSRLKSAAQSCRIFKEESWRVQGMEGVLVEAEVSIGGVSFHYTDGFLATNGYAYQLIGYGRLQAKEHVSAEVHKMLSRFEILDPARVAFGFETNFVSPHYYYSVNLTNSLWHKFDSLSKSLPHAEFGGSQGDSCFAITPVWFGGEKPGMQAIISAFLASFEIALPNGKLIPRKAINQAGVNCAEFDFQRVVEGELFRYRFRILERDGDGIFIAAWTTRSATAGENVLADALSRVDYWGPMSGSLLPVRQFTDREREAQSFFLNHAGLFYYNSGQYEKALPLFCAAVRVDNKDSITLVNALLSWRHTSRPKEALKFLEGLSPAALAAPDVRAHQAFFQGEALLFSQAQTNFAALFGSGYRNELRFTEYINLLLAQHQIEPALAEVKKYLEVEDSVSVRLLESDVYCLKKDFPKAIALLKAQREKAPLNTQVAGALAEACLKAGQGTEALLVAHNMVTNDTDSAYAHFLEGRAQLSLNRYREAKAAFESAASLSPTSKDIRSYLDYVSGMLGEGDNSGIKTPIEAVAIPADLTNATHRSVAEDYAKDYGAYYAKRLTALSVEPGGNSRTTEFILVQVLDQSGVAAFSTVQFTFDPLDEQVFVNDVHVSDSTGKLVSRGTVADYYVLDNAPGPIISQKKILNIPISGLRPGCQLSVMITRRMLEVGRNFPFQEHYFSASYPVQESLFFLQNTSNAPVCRTSVPIQPRKLPGGLCWTVADPVVARYEHQQLPGASFLPVLWMGDASIQWPQVSSNYLASINNRLAPDSIIQKCARELVINLTNDEAKICALASYVQTNCVYKAIEFGRRASVPNRPADTLRNKYGDCKDHAVLLRQMFETAGIPAHLALVSCRGLLQRDMPSLDQFDHMIVYLPNRAQNQFIDCTDKGADVAHVIPFGLADKDAFILDPLKPRFVSIPVYPDNASRIETQQRIRIEKSSDLLVEETLTLSGVHASFLRAFLLHNSSASQRAGLQYQLAMADLDLSDFKIQSLEKYDAPLILRFAYTLRNQFHRSNDRLAGFLRSNSGRTYLGVEPVEKRLSPFEIRLPFIFRSVVSIEIPAGLSPDLSTNTLPEPDSRFVVCREQTVSAEGALKIEFECRPRTGKYAATDYASYRESMARVLAKLQREIAFKVEPSAQTTGYAAGKQK